MSPLVVPPDVPDLLPLLLGLRILFPRPMCWPSGQSWSGQRLGSGTILTCGKHCHVEVGGASTRQSALLCLVGSCCVLLLGPLTAPVHAAALTGLMVEAVVDGIVAHC